MPIIYQPSQTVRKAYLNDRPDDQDILRFRNALADLLHNINPAESEEHNKIFVLQFLATSLYCGPDYRVNTYHKTDLAIYDRDHSPVVLFEFKGPGRPDMVTRDNLNRKALHELVLYYLREEVGNHNNDITHLVITDCTHYFVFEKKVFYRLFARNRRFAEKVLQADAIRTDDNDYIYQNIIAPVVETVVNQLDFTYIDLENFRANIAKDSILRSRQFIATFKFFSPTHLLRLPFSNDHNTLDNNFYRELLYIMGVEEVIDDKIHKIKRLNIHRQNYSLLEQTYTKLEDYGFPDDEARFEAALGLVLIWVNRVLFLKLLESQLVVFSGGDRSMVFLDSHHIPGYDELQDLFGEVLARPVAERNEESRQRFPQVPYLNSSLFELSDLERQYFPVGGIRLGEVEVYGATVLTDMVGHRLTGRLPLLDYLFRFLSAYDFGAESSDDPLYHKSKTIINASVLGLIFEKINGYKDGSFFTPGYITEYICTKNLRRAVVERFNAKMGLDCSDFEELKERLDYGRREVRIEANAIIDGLHVCDIAVGSGHFLVSALNELIAIKSELGMLQDHSDRPRRIADWDVRVECDELVVYNEDGVNFRYDPASTESQRLQETLFEEKRTIIENCLFGVDLNPKSVEICRLRLWIELLKNAYYQRAEDGTRELQTLPNIDINIKCGNSIASRLPVRVGNAIAAGEGIRRKVAQYKESVKQYKNSRDKALRNQLRKDILSIKESLNVRQTNIFEDNTRIVEDNATMRHAMEWMIEFPEVLSDDASFLGFDVIVGNPPYISLEKLRQDASVYGRMRQLDERNMPGKTYRTLVSRGDIYGLFVERALQLLRKGGHLGFIIPNKWTKVGYGQPLRKFFLERRLTDFVDFGDNQIFADATTYTCIISMVNEPQTDSINVSQIAEVHPETLADDIRESREVFPVAQMDDGIWVVSSLQHFTQMTRLQQMMPTLKDYVGGEFYRGILTGLTEAFVMSVDEAHQFALADDASRSLLRPLLRGRDMVAFGRAEAGSYLLFIPKGFTAEGMGIDLTTHALTSEEEAWAWFSATYPASAERLLPYRNRGRKRSDKGDYWWELRACAYYDQFEQPKIFYQAFQVKPCFVYDEGSTFCNNSIFFLSVPDKALLALLCSETGWWLISEFCPRIQNGHQLIWDNFSQIPIPTTLPPELDVLADELMQALADGDTVRYDERMVELNSIVERLYEV